jgi:hypothetical protein
MPSGDGTGPRGMGPEGWQKGPCAGGRYPERAYSLRRGTGYFRGFGRGKGFGFRARFNERYFDESYYTPFPLEKFEPSREEKIKILKSQREELERKIKELEE